MEQVPLCHCFSILSKVSWTEVASYVQPRILLDLTTISATRGTHFESARDKLPPEKTLISKQIKKKVKKQKLLHGYWQAGQGSQFQFTECIFSHRKIFLIRGTDKHNVTFLQFKWHFCLCGVQTPFKTQRPYRNGQNSLEFFSVVPASSTAVAETNTKQKICMRPDVLGREISSTREPQHYK